MRAQLLHLSGPLRGRTVTYEGQQVLIGTDPDADVRYPEETGVRPRHAEITFVVEGCAFYLRAIGGPVFVNRREVEEVVLEPGDLLEFGKDGPRARFRVHVREGQVCKPVRVMLGDALEVGQTGGVFAFTNSFIRDLFTHASWQLKVGVPLLALLILLPVAFFGGWLGGGRTVRSMATEQAVRDEQYERALAELRGELESVREAQQQTVSREEVSDLRREFEERQRVVDRLVAESEALRRIHDVYSRGVCLLYGAYGFQRDGDRPEFFREFSGRRLVLEYVGSGFLAGVDGRVITNDHLVRPWRHDPKTAQMESMGYRPVILRFLAVFPGRDPVEVDPSTFAVRDDDIDVAMLRVSDTSGVPVLPLFEGDAAELRGGRVVLLGYPTGVNALLAKASPDVVERLESTSWSLVRIIEGLAASRAITPIITQGSLSEILDQQLVYDADTTRGGSGGPLFAMNGSIIGVNYAILPDFTGSNFGVPIRFARELMDR